MWWWWWWWWWWWYQVHHQSSVVTLYSVHRRVSCGAMAPALPTGGQIFQTFVTLERVENHDPSKVVRSIGRTTNRQQLNMYRATIHIGAIDIIITIQYCNRKRTPMGEKSAAHPHAYIHINKNVRYGTTSSSVTLRS